MDNTFDQLAHLRCCSIRGMQRGCVSGTFHSVRDRGFRLFPQFVVLHEVVAIYPSPACQFETLGLKSSMLRVRGMVPRWLMRSRTQ
eukprot:5699704-Amphidinium_carterae.1